MKVIMVDAISLDGKITNDKGETHAWTSSEDWEHFLGLRDQSDVIVMGATTYEVGKPKPDPSRLRVVLTHRPEQYQAAAIPGQLEFATEKPRDLVARLTKAGYKQLLVAGGSHVNSDFLQAGLVHEFYLTFEPVLLGKGTPLLVERNLGIKLHLQSVRRLNDRGTLLAHYRID